MNKVNKINNKVLVNKLANMSTFKLSQNKYKYKYLKIVLCTCTST